MTKRSVWIMAMAMVIIVAALGTALLPALADNQMYIQSGTLRSIDLQARTILVDVSDLPQKFVVPTDAEISVKDKRNAELSDLLVGDEVQVKYTDDDGVHVAHQISVLGVKTP